MKQDNFDKPVILYVEDEELIRTELERFIGRFAKELYTAVDGDDGLEKYKKYSPDIVISDIQMPNKNGLEMANQIKELNPEQSIIFTTAFGENDYFLKAIELQVDGYILKPVDFKILRNKILDISERKETKKQLDLKEKIIFQHSKLASIGGMVDKLVHQWNKPLHAIIQQCNTAIEYEKNKFLTDEKSIQNFEFILGKTSYIAKSTENFRSFFQSKEQQSISVDLKNVVSKSVDLVEALYQKASISFDVDTHENINVLGQENQYVQVLVSILKYIEKSFDAANISDQKVVIIKSEQIFVDRAMITIVDNCGDISSEVGNELFEEQENGKNLELYVAKKIVDQYESAEISVYSKEYDYNKKSYQGHSFTIMLPVSLY